jgi:hypothetical protein
MPSPSDAAALRTRTLREKTNHKCCIGELSSVSLANRQNILLPPKPLNHQVVIHYGRIISNKPFSITPRAWEPAKFGRLPTPQLVGASTDQLSLAPRYSRSLAGLNHFSPSENDFKKLSAIQLFYSFYQLGCSSVS